VSTPLDVRVDGCATRLLERLKLIQLRPYVARSLKTTGSESAKREVGHSPLAALAATSVDRPWPAEDQPVAACQDSHLLEPTGRFIAGVTRICIVAPSRSILKSQ